jgi:NDP-sugar pyrophosphorylase family protein
MKITELFDLSKTISKPLFERFTYPEEVVAHIEDFLYEIISSLDFRIYKEVQKGVWVAKSASISPSATITAPCIIGEKTVIRQWAFLRGSVIIGNNCVVGNSSEVKNSILFDSVQVPHFNYVGDSILGYASHMGAGAVTSNVKSDKSEVYTVCGEERQNAYKKKLGAMLGDYVEIGCGTVLCPGSIIGRNTTVYPNSVVRGMIKENSIYKSVGVIVPKREITEEGL